MISWLLRIVLHLSMLVYLIAAMPVVAQNLSNLDALLEQAQKIESPLTRPFVCGSEQDLKQLAQSANSIVEVRLKRLCLSDPEELERIAGFKPTVEGKASINFFLVVEGSLKNRNATRGIGVREAVELFRLKTESGEIRGLRGFEAAILSDFAKPLGPRQSRDFAVVYALGSHPRNLTFLSPMAGNPIEIPIARNSLLLNGIQLPKPVLPFKNRKDALKTNSSTGPKPTTTAPTTSKPAVVENKKTKKVKATPEKPRQRERRSVAIRSIKERSRPATFPISATRLGGKIIRQDIHERNPRSPYSIEPTELIGERERFARLAVTAPDKRAVFVHSFSGGKTAQISAVRIFTKIGSGFVYRPAQIDIHVSLTGENGPWKTIATKLAIPKKQTFVAFKFDKFIEGNALRITYYPYSNSTSYRRMLNFALSKIEILEAPESDQYQSILRDAKVNALDAAYGGHSVAFTSQGANKSAFVSGFLMGPDKGTWQPGNKNHPQEFIFAFKGHDLQVLDLIEATIASNQDLPSDWTPVVRAEISEDISPQLGFRDIGYLSFNAVGKKLALQLPKPLSARYLKLIVVDAGVEPYGISNVSARGSMFKWLKASEVGSRPIEQKKDDANAQEEPNDNLSQAVRLHEGVEVKGQSYRHGDVDTYYLEVPGPKRATVNFFITGKPRLKSNIELLRGDGSSLGLYPASGNLRDKRFTWVLEPGKYYIRLSQDPPKIALAIDGSGSMKNVIYDALKAAETFVSTKLPREQIAIYRFSGSVEKVAAMTADQSVLLTKLDEWKKDHKPYGGGTSLHDALARMEKDLSSQFGNTAIVVLSDGGDSTSKLNLPAFWPLLSKFRSPIFSIGYGSHISDFSLKRGASARDTIRSFALATEGAYFEAPTPDLLSAIYGEIAERIRQRSSYRIHFEFAPARGTIEVLEKGSELVSSSAVNQAMIILDASGSMKAKTDAGRQRINVARTVLFDLMEQIPINVPLGLHVYGHSKPSNPKEVSCRDSELLVIPKRANRKLIKSAVKKLNPKGQTPIGYSLAQAGKELSRKGSGLIILLTDGEETCDVDKGAPYNPKRVVQGLIEQGLDLRVNIVGFDVTSPKVRAELAQLAKKTGGQFFYGEGQDGLRKALQSAFTARVEIIDDLGFKVAQTKVGGGPISLPEGHYRVQMGNSNFISKRQSVLRGRATRIYLEREADAVRAKVDQVKPDAPYRAEMNRSGSLSRPTSRKGFNPDVRFPETYEELIFKTQNFLNRLGYDAGSEDGIPGATTQQAIAAFIRDQNLSAGTLVDTRGNPKPLFWLELFAALQKKERGGQ